MIQIQSCHYTNPTRWDGSTSFTANVYNSVWNYASSTCTTQIETATTSTTIASSTYISITPTMTAGEILVSTLLFILIIVAVIQSLAGALWPVEIWRKTR